MEDAAERVSLKWEVRLKPAIDKSQRELHAKFWIYFELDAIANDRKKLAEKYVVPHVAMEGKGTFSRSGDPEMKVVISSPNGLIVPEEFSIKKSDIPLYEIHPTELVLKISDTIPALFNISGMIFTMSVTLNGAECVTQKFHWPLHGAADNTTINVADRAVGIQHHNHYHLSPQDARKVLGVLGNMHTPTHQGFPAPDVSDSYNDSSIPKTSTPCVANSKPSKLPRPIAQLARKSLTPITAKFSNYKPHGDTDSAIDLSNSLGTLESSMDSRMSLRSDLSSGIAGGVHSKSLTKLSYQNAQSTFMETSGVKRRHHSGPRRELYTKQKKTDLEERPPWKV